MTTIAVPPVLARRRELMRSLDVTGQPIKFIAANWSSKVTASEAERLIGAFSDGVITRTDLFHLGDLARAGDLADQRQLLIGTLLWGYGPRGGRSYINARRALNAANLNQKLAACIAAIKRADLRQAYLSLLGLPGYQEGYFTKYLYFAARNAPWPSDCVKPLIFDSRVRATLEFLARALGANWESALPARVAPFDRYQHYCQTVHRWADDLGSKVGFPAPNELSMRFSGATLYSMSILNCGASPLLQSGT